MKRNRTKRFLTTAAAFTMSLLVPFTSVWAAEQTQGMEKTQTVYVNADADGTAQKVIVSNWLKNPDQAETLTDTTGLNHIVNVKGDEAFTLEGDTITWQANGNDIYYQGESSAALPVGIRMTYFLDGKEISAQELAGKSGRVKIRIQYENYTQGSDFVPFLMATGMILPAGTFTNVEVTNGKVLSDGDKLIVAGIGFPGLEAKLGLAEVKEMKSQSIPDFVEITADARDFSLALTATVATTGTLEELGIKEGASLDELKDSVKKLTDSSQALVEGSTQLWEGMRQLADSTVILEEGLVSADDGAAGVSVGSKEEDFSKYAHHGLSLSVRIHE